MESAQIQMNKFRVKNDKQESRIKIDNSENDIEWMTNDKVKLLHVFLVGQIPYFFFVSVLVVIVYDSTQRDPR